MTIYAWARPRRFPRLPAPEARYFAVGPDARVLAHCYWQPRRHRAPALLALHGLEGSSRAHYMQGLADKAFARGLSVLLLNQRNCGGTEHLSRGLYHSGLTDDPFAVLDEVHRTDSVPAFAVIGYSLGGNLALKMAGEHASRCPTLPLRAAAAVSPTMDLARCVEALERAANVAYQWNFVRNLRARMRRKAAAWPGEYDLGVLKGVRTVRQFDEVLTAPHHGFRDADDYYYRASALRVVDRVRMPTLIVASADDPFVPVEQFDDETVAANAAIRRLLPAGGGHCGFIGPAAPDFDGYWAEEVTTRFAAAQLDAGTMSRRAGDSACLNASANSGPDPVSSCLK